MVVIYAHVWCSCDTMVYCIYYRQESSNPGNELFALAIDIFLAKWQSPLFSPRLGVGIDLCPELLTAELSICD